MCVHSSPFFWRTSASTACGSTVSVTSNEISTEITSCDGTLSAMVQLCKSGTDLARAHATQALLNLSVRELEILDTFMEGIYTLRALVEEALDPPPVVIASFVMHGVFIFSNKQTHWIAASLATVLDLPEDSITVTKVALYGTSIGCIAHVLIQLPLDSGDLPQHLPQHVAHTIVETSLNNELARELQAKGVNLTRTTLAEDPHVTKKNVFKGSGADMALGVCRVSESCMYFTARRRVYVLTPYSEETWRQVCVERHTDVYVL